MYTFSLEKYVLAPVIKYHSYNGFSKGSTTIEMQKWAECEASSGTEKQLINDEAAYGLFWMCLLYS